MSNQPTRDTDTEKRLQLSQEGMDRLLVKRSKELFNKIKKVGFDCLDDLTVRERDVIEMRAGMRDRHYTLEEIGKEFGVTRQAILPIEKRAIEKIETWDVRKNLVW